MRRVALIWLGATAVVSAIVGFISYGAGWAAGAASHLPAGAGPYYYGGPHFFGFFGFLPFLFLLFILLAVFRGARRRGPWGWGGWGYRGYGTPFQPYQPGTQPPPVGDPWQGWPQRPPQQQPQEQPQEQQKQPSQPEQDKPAQ
ncbi:MAG TPA: hypothetical protein VE953_02700 [Terriglobales bacterium]|nr:hypothetical protein [Terriglobales bacterium]